MSAKCLYERARSGVDGDAPQGRLTDTLRRAEIGAISFKADRGAPVSHADRVSVPRMKSGLALTALFTLALAGCGGPKITNNGIVVYAHIWDQTMAEILPQAEADLQCPQTALEVLLIRRAGRNPSELMVTGCGSQAYYNRTVVGPVRGGWRLTGIQGAPQQPMPNQGVSPVIVVQ